MPGTGPWPRTRKGHFCSHLAARDSCSSISCGRGGRADSVPVGCSDYCVRNYLPTPTSISVGSHSSPAYAVGPMHGPGRQLPAPYPAYTLCVTAMDPNRWRTVDTTAHLLHNPSQMRSCVGKRGTSSRGMLLITRPPRSSSQPGRAAPPLGCSHSPSVRWIYSWE